MIGGSLLVVSGPSGSGKSSLCKKLCAIYEPACLSISTTTRAPRGGETDGQDYFFVSKEAFTASIDKGEFLEWANVHGNYYGTNKQWVRAALEIGKSVIFDIDVQGQAAISKMFPNETTSVFVTAPNITILKERLIGRGADDAAALETRLKNALEETSRIERYDYLLINDNFEESLEILKGIAASSRIKSGRVSLRQFISNWQEQKEL
ncbi:MAG: guanylate kinase [Helicobacteraceae bacterium]|jgi:guanylate kinase|nr:guanylate kinase [Helicobacteraceae bacterium]